MFVTGRGKLLIEGTAGCVMGVPHPHDGSVAIRSMGPKNLGSFFNRNQANEILGGRDRLFH